MTPPVETPVRTGDPVAVARDVADRFRTTAAARERAGAPPVEELDALRASGLVNLRIPRELGGDGHGWLEAVRVVGELAAVDPTVGALLAYHFINFIPDLLDYETDGEDLQRLSAERRWLWGNVTQPWVPFRAEPTPDGGFVLNGVKPLNTGTVLADANTILAPRTDRREFVYVWLPRDRDGIEYHRDWDAFGFRRSETNTMTFTEVVVRPEEVLRDTHPGPRTTFPPYYLPGGNLGFAAIQVGAAAGALATAREIVRTSGEDSEADPALAEGFGGLWARVQGIQALRDEVARRVDDGYARRRRLTVTDIVDITQATEALRVHAARVAMDVGEAVFDLTGLEGADERHGLDRFWRDARIHSLHINPLIYHHRMLGDVHLNGCEVTGPPFFLD